MIVIKRTGVTSHDPWANNESIGAFDVPVTVVCGLDGATQDTIRCSIARSDGCGLEGGAGRQRKGAVGMFTPGSDRVSEGDIAQVEPLGERLEKVDITLLRERHRAAEYRVSRNAMI